MKTDIEIARETKLNKIEDIAEKLGVPRDAVSYTHLTLPTIA